MKILIASTFVPFIDGGGTQIVEDLRRELTARGFETDAVLLPLYSSYRTLSAQTLGIRLLDLNEEADNGGDRLITIRYPSYALRHPNKVAWFIHHHREAYDLWGTEWGNMPDDEGGRRYRDLMHCSDNRYLRECHKVFTNSQIVADRLRRFNGLEADGVLYPPLPRDTLIRRGPFGDYLLYISRICPIKRQELAIRAMKHTDPAVKLVLAGTGDVAAYFEKIQAMVEREGLSGRVLLTGWVSAERKAELLAGCCGALFLASQEDSYGYATLEAFHAGKPVITLNDSGGSLEVVENEHNGLVVPPSPEELAEAMNRLWRDRRHGQELGANAYQTPQQRQIHWDHVVEKLTA
jgi:glycosyltransferase involved in cell wall biosynthesis